jgi:hypothetical protein
VALQLLLSSLPPLNSAWESEGMKNRENISKDFFISWASFRQLLNIHPESYGV